ncbi:MAG: efflux RND transporter periplasmic adaptor subunit [Candidatus Azobacteroides sp.]|nr:efflux RND transporter periplasmic adaptor subunit [Candidatus Azobacteroides sp.]
MNTTKYFLLIFCWFFWIACSQKEEKQEEKKPLVKLEIVTEQPVAQTYDFTGTIQPFNENKIAPSVPLRIGRILVEVGDFVKPGQVVARMDKSQFAQQKAQLDNLKTTYERMKNLYDVGGISKHDLDQSETAMIVAQTAVANLDENSDLRSPIAGIVSERNYDSGDMYSGLPVVVVQQLNPVKVLINVTEELYPRLQKGMPVELKLDIYPGRIFNGSIYLIHPTVDPQTHTFIVEVTIPNSDLKVRPGMFGRITISLGTLNHVVVPDRAVIKQQGSGERFVYMFNSADSSVVRKVLDLGRRLDNTYEVVSGIDENTQVVVSGQTRLVDGMKVEVQK